MKMTFVYIHVIPAYEFCNDTVRCLENPLDTNVICRDVMSRAFGLPLFGFEGFTVTSYPVKGSVRFALGTGRWEKAPMFRFTDKFSGHSDFEYRTLPEDWWHTIRYYKHLYVKPIMRGELTDEMQALQ